MVKVGVPEWREEMVPLTVGQNGRGSANGRDRQRLWFSFHLLVLLIQQTCRFDRLRTEILTWPHGSQKAPNMRWFFPVRLHGLHRRHWQTSTPRLFDGHGDNSDNRPRAQCGTQKREETRRSNFSAVWGRVSHRIVESLRLEKTPKIISSNCPSIPTTASVAH